MQNQASFVEVLLSGVPELQEVYDDHLSFNRELLTHVFMGGVTRFVLLQAEQPDKGPLLKRLLQVLDEGLRVGSEDVRQLILASFVENLLGEDVMLPILWPMMEPALRRQVELVCEYTPKGNGGPLSQEEGE